MGFHSSIQVTCCAIHAFFSLLLAGGTRANQTSSPPVPALIVFGDSIVDPGNNNEIKTIVKCNFPPYGKDFAGHEATGRFCNGKIPTDFMASKLGIKEYLPAYLGTTLSPEDILTGVSFASGGTGYDPLTPQLVSVLSMPDQLKLFKQYTEKLRAIAGEEKAATILSDSLYLICAGSDDIANTYFTSPFRRPHYDIPSYVNLMVNSASSFVEELVGLGARRIAFVGLPPIGCLPSQRTLGGGITRSCESSHNQAATLFNSLITEQLRRISNSHRDRRIVFFDIYSIFLELVQHPSRYGFSESTKGCCGTGALEVSVLCNSLTSLTCEDDTSFVFWDSYHPTERTYGIITEKLFERYIPQLL
ncbi:hypothetical protein Taro_050622 [Colocasia esculenta]|uniref:GDSL esterase/lipase EXL3 n=1 Tax=Colocasia esculenta TaxID=4460 RepID=A0A843XEJ5_COLES|nr:hypothetical protein [Colocasia esculenta]